MSDEQIVIGIEPLDSYLPRTQCTKSMRKRVDEQAAKWEVNESDVVRAAVEFFLSSDLSLTKVVGRSKRRKQGKRKKR